MRRLLSKLIIFSLLILFLDHLCGAALRKGLDRYFGFDKPANILCVGHSHTMLGIDSVALEKGLGLSVAKYAINGATIADRDAMIRHYLERSGKATKVIVYDVDDHLFTQRGLSDNSYRLFYPYLDSEAINRHIKKQAGNQEEYLVRQLLWLPRFNSVTLNLAVRGMTGRIASFKTGTLDENVLRRQIDNGSRTPGVIDPSMEQAFRETVKYVRSQGIIMVLLAIPTVDLLNNLDKNHHDKVFSIFREMAAYDSGILFLDYNPFYASDHRLFSDPVHMNRNGQAKVTTRLLNDLVKITGVIQ